MIGIPFSIMQVIFVLLLSGSFFKIVTSSSNQYCATINASGALGHVSMEISNGVAQYMFNLDVNSLDTPSLTCDYSKGLTFHIHSYWNNADTFTSVAYPTCSSTITGLHYDPNFACSSKSQQSSTGCKSLNRYFPHYNYTCNSTVFNQQGQYSLCEVGDLTGKFGSVYPTSSTNLQFSISTPWTDYLPPYAYDFDRADLTSNMWSSIVFHCKSPSAYLLCAKLSMTDLQSCSSDFAQISSLNSGSSSSDSGSNGQYSAGSLAAGILVSMFSFFFIGMGTLYLLQSQQGLFLVHGLIQPNLQPPSKSPSQVITKKGDEDSNVVKSSLHDSSPQPPPPQQSPEDIERQSTFM
jgi:hypothetical protein